ncbi:MAG: M35 family metallo-endopeptidase [Sulfitobacter sp.]
MGLNAIANNVQADVSKLSPFVMGALQSAAERVASGAANAAMTRWFGDNSGGFRTTLAKDIRRMRSQINVRTINVGFEKLNDRDSTTNASAWPSAGKIGFGNNMAHVGASSAVDLDMNFKNLPMFLPLAAGAIDSTAAHQSKLNTLIHELSHLLVGTDDEFINGAEAYGAQAAEAIAAANVPDAKNNAENWGIFIEAVGHHNTT